MNVFLRFKGFKCVLSIFVKRKNVSFICGQHQAWTCRIKNRITRIPYRSLPPYSSPPLETRRRRRRKNFPPSTKFTDPPLENVKKIRKGGSVENSSDFTCHISDITLIFSGIRSQIFSHNFLIKKCIHSRMLSLKMLCKLFQNFSISAFFHKKLLTCDDFFNRS